MRLLGKEHVSFLEALLDRSGFEERPACGTLFAEFSLCLSGRQVTGPWMDSSFLTMKWGYEVLSRSSVTTLR